MRFLGGCMLWIALTLSGLRWIPFDVIMNPKNLPLEIPKKYFVGFIFSWCARIISNIVSKSRRWSFLSRTFCRLSEVVAENYTHCTLISCSRVLQSERHHDVAVYPQRCSERCMLFVIRVHLDLIVSREPIHERHSFKPTRAVDHPWLEGGTHL